MTNPVKSDNYAKDRISIIQRQEKLSQTPTDFLYDVCMEIKDWISAARKAAGVTQDALAEKLDVTRGNVSGWENGRHEPSLSQIKKIAQVCEADMSPLFDDMGTGGTIALKKGVPWPFGVDYKLFKSVDQALQADLDEYVTFKVEKWHKQNPMKSEKVG